MSSLDLDVVLSLVYFIQSLIKDMNEFVIFIVIFYSNVESFIDERKIASHYVYIFYLFLIQNNLYANFRYNIPSSKNITSEYGCSYILHWHSWGRYVQQEKGGGDGEGGWYGVVGGGAEVSLLSQDKAYQFEQCES